MYLKSCYNIQQGQYGTENFTSQSQSEKNAPVEQIKQKTLEFID